MSKRVDFFGWLLIILAIVILCFTIFVNIKYPQKYCKCYEHPEYKMEAMYDKEAKTIFWKGINFKESPLGTVHLTCDCGNHSNGGDNGL